MEKRVVLELRGKNPSQIKELNLDNCRSTSIVGLTDEYVNLEILSLNNVGLTSLKGFPTLPKLRKLELSDNRISNGLNFLNGCKKLTHLNLSGNKIKDLETLKPLEEFVNLKNLDLFNNDVTYIEEYRSKVFALHPSLKFLDGFDKEDREAEDSDEEDEMLDEMIKNGNNDSDDDVDIDLGPLVIDDDIPSQKSPETRPSLLMSLYAIYGILFHMGYLLKSSEGEEDDDDESLSLSAVYNENLDEESSASSLFEGSSVEEEEDVDDEEGDCENDADHNSKAQDGEDNTREEPEESTRGKKRKHEDDEEN